MAADGEDERAAKAHRERKSGPKAEKKKKRKQGQNEESDRKNPKAFTFQSTVRAARQIRRKLDVQTKKHHVPLVDRTPLEPPPIVVAVIGPPKVGKSTLIGSLLKNFTRQNLTTIKGPITIVSGKNRRLTIIECGNDMNMMVDIAKIADLALLLIDASFGFEMEIFEFLNICQVHGFPKIMGVLTHLDLLKDNKSLKKTKKRLKNRFWTEVYQGAKLFYISGISHGHYPKTEIHNLGRFISVAKFRPLAWRSSHPYVLADRIEDLTDAEELRQNPKCDRKVSFYGYVRGANVKPRSKIHLLGVGDFEVKEISKLPDPCPLPEKEKKRSLNEKEKLLYAPMCGVGGVMYDKDAVYIDLGGSHHNKKGDEDSKQETEDTPGNEFLSSLSGMQETIDAKMASSKLSLFKDSLPLGQEEVESWKLPSEEVVHDSNRVRRKATWKDDDSDDENNGEGVEDDNDEDNDDNDGDHDDNEDDDANSVDEDDDANSVDEDENRRDKNFNVEKTESLVYEEDDSDGIVEYGSDSDEHVDLEDVSDNDNDASSDDVPRDCQVKHKKRVASRSSEEPYADNRKAKKRKLSTSNEDETTDSESGAAGQEGLNDSAWGKQYWSKNLMEKARDAYLRHQNNTPNLKKLIYGQGASWSSTATNENEDSDDEAVGGLFKMKNRAKSTGDHVMHERDCSKVTVKDTREWQDILADIKDCFVSGKWKETEDAEALLQLDDQDDEIFGDFEDLETGEVHRGEITEKGDEHDDEHDEEAGDDEEKEKQEMEERIEKKKKLKTAFDTQYDDGEENTYYDDLKAQMTEQARLNQEEFEGMDDETRIQYEGYRAGMYIRIEIGKIPCEFINNFNPTYPVILGGLLSNEDNIGYIRVRLKKHRWYKRILKTRDPLIMSIGWRRFQTVTMYSTQDHNGRYRSLKYTPEHLHCVASAYGPIVPPGTGVLAVQSVADVAAHFRIAATGVILDLDKSVDIVKKLKLTGTPLKIYKNTAFIKFIKFATTLSHETYEFITAKGMFNSSLEVAKFEGANVRTVSGIRGQVKKAVKAPDGAFRATFEDKILMSDIVFIRCWYPVTVPKYYNPVTSLLISSDDKSGWQGMRTVAQIRRDRGLEIPLNKDSLYKPIERMPRRFNPLVVPKQLQKDLPFKSKPKLQTKRKKPSLETRRAVVMEPDEKRAYTLMQQLYTANKEKLRKRKEKMAQKRTVYLKQKAKDEAKRNARQKENRKKIFRMLGQAEKRKQRRGRE